MKIKDKLDLICLKRGISGCSIKVKKDNDKYLDYIFGYSNIESGRKIKFKSKFHIASITKSITAMALMQFLQTNSKYSLKTTVLEIISLDTDLYNLFMKYETFKNYADKITLKQLISHRSGLRHYISNEEFLEAEFRKKSHLQHPKFLENLKVFGDDKLLFEPDTNFHYSSYGYVLLTILIEIMSQVSYFNFINRHLLLPTKMHDTIFVSDKNTVEQYYRTFQYVEGIYKTYSKLDFEIVKNHNIYMKGGAGMLISNANDLTLFAGQVFFSNFFNKNTKSKIFKGLSKISDQNWYALGWHQNKPSNPTRIWHSGGAIGGSNYLEINLEKNMTIVILCNTQIDAEFHHEILKLIYLF